MIDWLRGKRRNRRFGEREHVLDVKLRTSRARAARLRVFGVGAAVVLSLAAAWRGGQWLLDRLIYKNDAFAIEHIEVQTDGVLTSETIRRWAMVKTGENLMALDLARVQAQLGNAAADAVCRGGTRPAAHLEVERQRARACRPDHDRVWPGRRRGGPGHL